MSSKKSLIWLHFTEMGVDTAKCNMCQNLYSYKGGTTGNLRKHIRIKHPTTNIEERPTHSGRSHQETEVDEIKQSVPEQDAMPSTSKDIKPGQPTTVIKQDANEPPIKRLRKQATLSKFVSRPISLPRQKKINDLILDMIVKDLQPFTIIQDKGFLDLLHYLEPSYKPPSRNTFITSLLEEKYERGKSLLKNILKEASSITLTKDGWTSAANESYISVTAHFVTNNWEFVSCLLSCFKYADSHTSQNLCEELKKVVTEWEIQENIHFIVTDNAANVVAAAKLTGWTHLPCFAHTLNLIVQQGLHEIGDLRVKIKGIVEYFHRSTQANMKLLSTQTKIDPNSAPLKLKNDVVTRWNSTYYMLERILKLEEPLTATLGLLHNPVQSLTGEEWQILREVCQILQPFEQMTCEMSAEKSITVSKIIVVISGLTSVLRRFQSSVKSDMANSLIINLLGSISKRFLNLEYNQTLSKALLLDPRFKRKGFSVEAAYIKAKDKLQDEMTAIIKKRNLEQNIEINVAQQHQNQTDPSNDNLKSNVTGENTSLIWQEFDLSVKSDVQDISPTSQAIIELRMFLEEPLIRRQEDTLLWWKSRCLLYPTISILAKKYLGVVATSVPSERVFSKAGQIISERRNRLKSKHVSQIIFLNCNQLLFNHAVQ